MSAIPKIVPFSDLRIRQAEVLEALTQGPVILAQRGRPSAVLVSIEKWNELIERLEEAEDTLEAIEVERNPEPGADLEEYLEKRGIDVSVAA